MDIQGPRYAARDHDAGAPPAIYSDHPPRSLAGGARQSSSVSSRFSPPSKPIPMSISHQDEVPPPLPPPKYFTPISGPVEQPPYGDHEDRPDSLYGSFSASFRSSVSPNDEWPPSYKSRRESATTIKGEAKDEGYASLSTLASMHSAGSPQTRFRVHDQYQFRPSVDDYDSSLLKKLDSRRGLDNRSPPRRSGLTSFMRHTAAARQHGDRPGMQLEPLSLQSLPTRLKQPMGDSPGRFGEPATAPALSPRSLPFGRHFHGGHDTRSPSELPHLADHERSPDGRTHRTNSGSVPDDMSALTQDSYDAEPEFAMDETSKLRSFHLDDNHHARPLDPLEHPITGQKRRASSPPLDGPPLHSMPSSGDLARRRDGVPGVSPQPRLTVIPQHGSISSVSSAGGRSSSFMSSSSMTASSMSSIHSFGRRSPVQLSPPTLSPTDTIASPFSGPLSLVTSPQVSSAGRGLPHQRTLSDQNKTAAVASPRKLSDIHARAGGNVTKMSGFLMCDCCPKKPKKFETEEELSAHQHEKQYECSYCGNRFKNKNEMERHQNSLHVRRHSWSCSALSGYDRAFHESPTRPGEADMCGYCGKEFPRSGAGGGPSRLAQATEEDWEERIRHLSDVHKFRECNSSKKFYRADHFRQHLKHSHAGTSGKWTNMLETACMMEEEEG